MFCCSCGTSTVDDALFCHKCGKPIPREPEPQEVAKDNRLSQCHNCGRDAVHGWDFGLGKPLRSRTWSGTAASVVVSAVTIPLIGVGAFQLPGKRTTMSVLRLRLLLCDTCARRGGIGYSVHPLWGEAMQQGFTEFLNADELKSLRPTS